MSIRTYIEIAAAVSLLAAYFLFVHHERAVGAQACIQATTVTKEMAAADVNKNLADYQTNQAKPAEAQHEDDLAAIDLRVIRTPILVHDGALCPGPVHPTAAKAGENSPAAGPGGVVGGTGSIDIRPALEAFKAKLETIVADDRREDADWQKLKP